MTDAVTKVYKKTENEEKKKKKERKLLTERYESSVHDIQKVEV